MQPARQQDPRPVRVLAQPARPRRRIGPLTDSPLLATALAALAAGIAFVLRAINLNRSFEIFFDDVIYTRISYHVATHLEVTYSGSTPFFLHPPLFFFIEGAYVRVLQVVRPQHAIVGFVFEDRYLNAAFAAATAVVLFFLCRRLAGLAGATAATLLFALDPFVIRIDSRNLLEPSAVFWIVLGIWLLLWAADQPWRRWRVLPVGLAFGGALLTNEPSAFVTVVPLAALFVLRWGVPRRTSLQILVVALLTYASYPVGVALTGHWATFWKQKSMGLLRFGGFLQVSGFNAHAGRSFSSALFADLTQFTTSYGIIALGAVATVGLVLLGTSRQRLIATFAAGAYLEQAFSVVHGTNEEQYYLYVIVPAIIVLVTGMRALVDATASRTRVVSLAPRVVAVLLICVFVVLAGRQWVIQHTTADNGEARLYAYLEENIPAGARIGYTGQADGALLLNSPYHENYVPTGKAVGDNHDAYVIVPSRQVKLGYTGVRPGLLPWLRTHGTVVFQTWGPTNGDLVLYRIRTR